MFEWFRKHIRKIGVFGVEVEFHPPSDASAHKPTTTDAAVEAAAHATSAGPSVAKQSAHVSADKPTATDAAAQLMADEKRSGLTFDEVIEAIRRYTPAATLGRTAEEGQYFERARRLRNFRLYGPEPPSYGAVQANGKTMWLYLGKGDKICCGDKE